MEKLPETIAQTVARTVEMAEAMAAYLSNHRPIFLLARGASQEASLCGRLVLEEVARQPAVFLEAAEFRQGPNEVVDAAFGAVVFLGGGETAPLTRSLAREIDHYGGKVISVGCEDNIQDLPGFVFPIPPFIEPFQPICEIIPIQGLAYKLAEKRGISPGSVRYISKIIREESASSF